MAIANTASKPAAKHINGTAKPATAAPSQPKVTSTPPKKPEPAPAPKPVEQAPNRDARLAPVPKMQGNVNRVLKRWGHLMRITSTWPLGVVMDEAKDALLAVHEELRKLPPNFVPPKRTGGGGGGKVLALGQVWDVREARHKNYAYLKPADLTGITVVEHEGHLVLKTKSGVLIAFNRGHMKPALNPSQPDV